MFFVDVIICENGCHGDLLPETQETCSYPRCKFPSY